MKIVKLIGEIELLSGLHIGGGDDTMKIGGIDNQVIKEINTGKPYIPGSSLKGKMRSLLEWDLGLVGIGEGKPFSSKMFSDPLFQDSGKKLDAEIFLSLFGDPNPKSEAGITRISVGDCALNAQSEGKIWSEAKFENVIDRKSGTAQHPRQTERVPAGIGFDYDIRIKVLDQDDEETLKWFVKRGLELIENDYLGGSGSRGYGRVRFSNKDNWIE
jgi:CRISPR-associated protein Csm3